MRTIIQIICVLVGGYLLMVIIMDIWTQVRLRTGKIGSVPGNALGSHGELATNDRIWLSGGYDDAKWLSGNEGYFGTVISFIPGQNSEPAALIRLDRKITSDNVTGDILVLELRWIGAKWGDQGVVHVELCDFMPEKITWKDRRQGKWVESHASYKKIKKST